MGKLLLPPKLSGLTESQVEAWQNSVEARINGQPHAPSYVLKGRNGSTPIDLIQVGMILECQDLVNPEAIWFVKVLKNIGGRLRLRYEGDRRCSDGEEESSSCVSSPFPASSSSFWLFYSSPFLHPIGWGVANGFEYRPPTRIIIDDDPFHFWVETLRQTLFAPPDGAGQP